jgi:hypothetical protein
MTSIGQTVKFHTTSGDRAAIVTGHGQNGDNDTLLAVFAGPGDESDTGLTGDVNRRWSKPGSEAGEFTTA